MEHDRTKFGLDLMSDSFILVLFSMERHVIFEQVKHKKRFSYRENALIVTGDRNAIYQ